MPAKRAKPPEPEPTGPTMKRKQITLDAGTLEGLKVIQAHEPDVRGDSAAIRYAVRTAVERLAARKSKPRS